ncbi:MAG: iron-sulfur cluster assembly protein, partial [Pseudomonadota bacterium]|nr:iron-sulfur cluster assembly protein [Pseudomonadota bacterium]
RERDYLEGFLQQSPPQAGTGGAGSDLQTAVIDALKEIYDPEIPVNIYDLGLIYDLTRAADGDIHVVMTLTTPGCPVAGILPQQVADAAAAVDGVGAVVVELTWEPSWSPERMSEDARLALDMM